MMLSLEVRALLHGAGEADPLEAFPSSVGNATPSVPSSVVMPLSSLPALSSRSIAAVKVYLDFIGAPATTWGTYHPTETPAYDTDNDATTFSQNELTQIHEVWSRVSEKYSPFNVDVTTVDPKAYPFNQVVRVVIGGDGAWTGARFGGFGYVNGFTGDTSNTAFVFAKNLGEGSPRYIGEAAAHEAGHNFGLYHQSVYGPSGIKTDEYNRGTFETAPIMGFSYYADRGLWWSGASSASNTNQADVEIIAGALNGFGYRDDDHGDGRASADQLVVGEDGLTASATGVIEKTTDVDYFKFTSLGGIVDFKADVAPFGAMLDLALTLTDASGNVMAVADTESLGESISLDTVQGDYFLAVSSRQGYGDIGQYSISISMVPEPLAMPIVLGLAGAWLFQRPRPGVTPHCGAAVPAALKC